jgi:hypothetical protein
MAFRRRRSLHRRVFTQNEDQDQDLALWQAASCPELLGSCLPASRSVPNVRCGGCGLLRPQMRRGEASFIALVCLSSPRKIQTASVDASGSALWNWE